MQVPASEADLAEVVAAAQGPLAVRGGGTRGMVAGGDAEVLDMTGVSGITLYEPGALTIVARAGTPVAEVDAALSAEGQRLPFEPMDHRVLMGTSGTPTLGGVVAANVSGPRRIQAGACRDSLIGVRFVDGQGQILKNGGRVMKNVTGYDLVKLLCGSFGTLGVLTEVAFKVLPRPDSAASLSVAGLDPARAVEMMSAALGAPFEVSGAAYIAVTDPVTSIRIEGFAASVAYRAERLIALLAPFGEVRVERDPEAIAKGWADIRDVRALADVEDNIWRISVKPSDGPRAMEALGQPPAVMDWGGGLIWAALPEGRDARAALDGIAGHATLVRGARGDMPIFHPEPGLEGLAAGLRARFDPRGILNPGLMG